MPLQQFLTSGQPDGTAATTGNTGASQVTTTGGSATWKNDTATGRTKVVLVTNANGTSINCRFALSDATQHKIQRTVKWTTPAVAPSQQYRLGSFRHASGVKATVGWETDGRVQFLASDSINPVVIPAGTLALNTEYVFAFTLDDTTGTATLRIFAVGSSTPIWSKTDISGQNYVSAQPFTHIDNGSGIAAGTIAVMDDQVNAGSGSEIPDYVPSTPLGTPVVTLGTVKNPTTDTATDGTQQISWPAVANAATYDARLATTATPQESDFTTVATGVTSPYTFTGLGKGTFAFGVKPQP